MQAITGAGLTGKILTFADLKNCPEPRLVPVKDIFKL